MSEPDMTPEERRRTVVLRGQVNGLWRLWAVGALPRGEVIAEANRLLAQEPPADVRTELAALLHEVRQGLH